MGVLVATFAAATRFAAIGILPPSFKMKPFAHASASTTLVLGEHITFGTGSSGRLNGLSPRTYTLADMISSPEVTAYVARAASLPASKIGVLGPLWTELWRSQQWANGPKRASQIVIEKDPYQISISQETNQPPWPPVIDVQTQAPSPQTAERVARAVADGLNAYVQHLQTATQVPEQRRYEVRQLTPVSVAPAKKSRLLNVGVFTFFAVFVLWCGAQIAAFSLMRDLQASARLASRERPHPFV